MRRILTEFVAMLLQHATLEITHRDFSASVDISIYMEIVLLFSFYPLSFIYITAYEPAPVAVYLLSFIRASVANNTLSRLVLSSLIMRYV